MLIVKTGSYKKGPFGSSLTKSIFIPDGNNAIKVYEQKNAIKKDWKLGEYFISEEYYNRNMKNFTVFPGDIIVSCAGTIGETYVLPDECRIGIINQALMRISLMESVYKDFYLLYFNFMIKGMAQFASQGTALKNIPSFDVFKNMLMVFPPLTEQHRIVERVDAIMSKLDELEKAENELENIKKKFPDDMRDSLLQAAIQGKLTKQRPEDGTAEELLKEIRKEKERLIAEGKMKPEKPLKPIADEEKPFDIPESWAWVRLGEITFNHGQKKPERDFCYIDVGSIDNKKCQLGNYEIIIKPENASSRARKIIKQNDIIYATIRPYLHNACIVNRVFSKEIIASTAFAVMHCYGGIITEYLFSALLSPMFDNYANAPDKSKGVAYPAIGEKDFFYGLIPLPPLAEQERIVERLNKLLPLCEAMKGE